MKYPRKGDYLLDTLTGVRYHVVTEKATKRGTGMLLNPPKEPKHVTGRSGLDSYLHINVREIGQKKRFRPLVGFPTMRKGRGG